MFSSAKILAVAFSAESFTEELYEKGLSLVDGDSQERIKRFFHKADSYRCLLGRLLPRLVLLQLGFRTDDIMFARSETGKPFLATSHLDRTIGFNISHDQFIVVMAFQTLESDPSRPGFASPQPDDRRFSTDPCAKPQAPPADRKAEGNSKHMMTTLGMRSEPITLIGVDVMRIALPRFAKTLRAFVSTIEDTLTPTENAFLVSFCPPENIVIKDSNTPEQLRKQKDGLRYLFLIWTLKEAYTKALGLGLGFDFKRIECRFRLQYEGEKKTTTGCSDADIRLLVDGLELNDWDLQTCEIRLNDSDSETYQVAIARRHYSGGGNNAGDPSTSGRVIDRGIMQCNTNSKSSSNNNSAKLQASHLDVPRTRRNDVRGTPGAHELRISSSDTATEEEKTDIDGRRAAFGPLGTDALAVLPTSSPSSQSSSRVQDPLLVSRRGNSESRAAALEGDFAAEGDDVYAFFQSYDASTVIEIVSALSTPAGSGE